MTQFCQATVTIIVLKVGHVYGAGKGERGRDGYVDRKKEKEDREKKGSWEKMT